MSPSSQDAAGSGPSAPVEEPTEKVAQSSTDEANTAGAATVSHAAPGPDLEAAGQPSMIGKTFGDYELLSEIGRGGMGVVYKARQKSLERVVAVKVLIADHLQHPAMLARFLTEARTVAALRHPNIVNVFQIGQEGPWHYFVMEFIEGQTLDALTKGRVVPVAWAVNVMIPVAEAVHHAHGCGIVHRDLKPGNIMNDRFNRPIVMDFGIAKSVHKPSSLTQEGAIVGTASYMSPEQAGEDVGNVGPLSDVYSLGAVLYRLLAGKPPFDEGSFLKTVLKVIGADAPPPLQALRPDVPKVLEQICMKCLSKRPEDRYPSAKALAEELRQCRATYLSTAGSSTKPKAESAKAESAKAESAKAPPAKAAAESAAPVQPAVYLVSQETKKPFRIKEGTTLIGRSKECKLVLKVGRVSKRHCQIEVHGEEATIEDLGSANGTLVNGKRIERSKLRDGDALDIAGHIFTVRVKKPDP